MSLPADATLLATDSEVYSKEDHWEYELNDPDLGIGFLYLPVRKRKVQVTIGNRPYGDEYIVLTRKGGNAKIAFYETGGYS